MRYALISWLSVLLATALMAQPQPSGRLIPVGAGVGGAHGSDWVVEHFLHNRSAREIQVTNVTQCPFSAEGACLVAIPPHSTLTLANVVGPFEYWFVPEEDIEAFTISSYVRNVSDDIDPWGTLLPSPRLAEFRPELLRLAPIPATGDYRLSLRAYTHPVEPAAPLPATVEVWRLDDSLPLLVERDLLKVVDVVFTGEAGASNPRGVQLELHALLDDLTVESEARLSIRIVPSDPQRRIWAFASLTHNESQHVTIFTP